MKWDDVTDEKPNASFRRRVLESAEIELAKSRPVRLWQRRFVLTGALASLAALIWLRKNPAIQDESEGMIAATAGADADMLENVEMLTRLELLEDLDILESWSKEAS